MADTNLAQTIYDALLFAGATPTQAAGIMGNMMQESGFDPESRVMDSNGAYSQGLIMWNDMGAGAGVNWANYITGNVQQDIVQQVLLLKEQGAFAAASGNTPEEAAANFMANFERPAAATANEARRTGTAAEVAAAAASGNWASVTGETTGSLPQSETGGSTSSANGIPGLGNIPGLIQYIQQNFPDEAWLLNIPSVATTLEDAVANGDSDTQIQALIAQTAWWKDTSAAMRQYEQNLYTNPADYSFTNPGSKVSQEFADVVNQSAQIGVTLNTVEAQTIALEALQYGWDSNQIQAKIGSYANTQDAQAIVSQLQSQQGQYLIPISPAVQESWIQNIAEGKQSIQQWEAYLKQQAALKWTGMAPQLNEGYTPIQIVSGLQDNAAQIMETSPQAIDFINNPQYAKILDFVPPGETQPRIMTQSEESQYLKGLPQYAYTQNARDSVSQLGQTIVQTFGKIGS